MNKLRTTPEEDRLLEQCYQDLDRGIQLLGTILCKIAVRHARRELRNGRQIRSQEDR